MELGQWARERPSFGAEFADPVAHRSLSSTAAQLDLERLAVDFHSFFEVNTELFATTSPRDRGRVSLRCPEPL